jgi:hypothetical protein
MSSGEKNIDRIFRDRLRNFDAEPPVEVWDNIKENLYRERKRIMTLWISRIAAGIAILTVLSVSYFIARNTIREKLISGDKTKTETGVEEGTSITKEESPGGEFAEQKLSEGESQEQVSPDLKPDDRIEKQEIKEELKIVHIVISPANNDVSHDVTVTEELQPDQVQGTSDFLATSFQGPIVTSVQSKSVGQLEYKLPGMSIKHSGYKMEGKSDQQDRIPEREPDGDIYALNIPTEEENQENRWAIGTQVSPMYSYRNIETQNESMALADNFNQSESGAMAYSGGVNVNYSLLRRLSLQSGVYYSRYGVNVDNAYVFEDVEGLSSARFYSINNSSGIIDIENVDYVTNKGDHKYYNTGSPNFDKPSPEVSSGEIIQNFEYIEVPLILRYRLIDRKIGFNFLGGLSTNLLVGSNTYYHSGGDREKIGKTTDIKPFNYSSIVGLGLDYAISQHLKINLEPTFRYYLNSINQSSVIRSYPYSFGIFTGLRYNF